MEALTAQLETARADALQMQTEAKDNADILTAQVETLTAQLETARADALKMETDAKTNADKLTAQVETLTAQLETAKADVLKKESDAKANTDKLTAQVEDLTARLETARVDISKMETEAKAAAEETARVRAGMQQQIDDLSAQLKEADDKTLSLQSLLESTENEKAAVLAEAQVKADELTAQAAGLSAELESVSGMLNDKEDAFTKLEKLLAESETSRIYLQSKLYAKTATAIYRNNTVCTFGIHLRDIMPKLTDKWYTVTPIDLSKNGTQSFELIASNMWIIGQVNVTVDGDSVLIDRDIILEGIGRTKILSEYLNIFPDLNSITPEALEDDGLYGKGYSFGEPISIEKDLGGDTNVLLYVRNVATFHPRVSDTRFLERMWENLPHRINQRNAMNEMMDPLTEEAL